MSVQRRQVVGLLKGVGDGRICIGPAVVTTVNEIPGRQPMLGVVTADHDNAGAPLFFGSLPFHTDDPNGTWTWDYLDPAGVIAVEDVATAADAPIKTPDPQGDPGDPGALSTDTAAPAGDSPPLG